MSFAPNPLSLSVPEPAFESWLRDSGYLDLLDHRTTLLHHLHSSPSPTTTPTPSPPPSTTPSTTTTTITAVVYTLTMSLISSLATLLSLLTLNPFAKLTSSDFSSIDSKAGSGTLRNTGLGPNDCGDVLSCGSWTSSGFLGSFETYSFPSNPIQAQMRVHENVKRFAKHYSVLFLVFFACSLYQMPLALIGLLSCLAVWELFRYCDARWALERFPSSRQVLIRVGQCAVAAILFWSNVQMAVFVTIAVSYAVLILHASFRKLTPTKQPSKGRGR
ncbi:hypothetical protein RND81_09G017600 [Saponaria officinalis]|uniref:PRA1 family protein n=1 Tax=Saponaria officinalis TaxID=3572 RepID=A0AAW1IFY0_SAPOF